MRWSLSRTVSALLLGGVALLVTPWVLPGEVRPIRFDSPEPEPLVLVDAEQILEAHIQRVATFGLASNEAVPADALRGRCADRDGCRLRLMVAGLNSPFAGEIKESLFSVGTNLGIWGNYSTDGAELGVGSTTAPPMDVVLSVTELFGTCTLAEGGANEFVLDVQSVVGDFDCTLRIDD